MIIAMGSDHAGFILKTHLKEFLLDLQYDVRDFGTYDTTSTDYPDYALLVAKEITEGKADLGLLVCGTGVGMSIAANKVKGVRAAAVSEPSSARLSRQHNNANIVCMGARVVGQELAEDIMRAFLNNDFSNGERHCRRIAKISAMEGK